MGEPGQEGQHQTDRQQNSTPAEIRRKVASYQAHKQAARRRRHGYYRAALLLAALSLAAPLLIRHRHGLTHGCFPSRGSRRLHESVRGTGDKG